MKARPAEIQVHHQGPRAQTAVPKRKRRDRLPAPPLALRLPAAPEAGVHLPAVPEPAVLPEEAQRAAVPQTAGLREAEPQEAVRRETVPPENKISDTGIQVQNEKNGRYAVW